MNSAKILRIHDPESALMVTIKVLTKWNNRKKLKEYYVGCLFFVGMLPFISISVPLVVTSNIMV